MVMVKRHKQYFWRRLVAIKVIASKVNKKKLTLDVVWIVSPYCCVDVTCEVGLFWDDWISGPNELKKRVSSLWIVMDESDEYATVETIDDGIIETSPLRRNGMEPNKTGESSFVDLCKCWLTWIT